MNFLHRPDNVVEVLDNVMGDNLIEVIARERPRSSVKIDNEIWSHVIAYVDVHGVWHLLGTAADVQKASIRKRAGQAHAATLRLAPRRFQRHVGCP
ncbi:MAG: hypothetical protein ACRELY_13905 [Polyangiaceae bacterium]